MTVLFMTEKLKQKSQCTLGSANWVTAAQKLWVSGDCISIPSLYPHDSGTVHCLCHFGWDDQLLGQTPVLMLL